MVQRFVAECLWPDVGTADLDALDRRIAAATAELNRLRRPVRYLGWLLLREDEVVFCQFEGTADSVREAAERARVPFDRILATSSSQRHRRSTGVS